MIEKQKFEEVYRQFSPSKCEMFYIKYLSVASLHEHRFITWTISIGLLLPFLLSICCEAFHLNQLLETIASTIYITILALSGLGGLLIWYKRKTRFDKIRKELNISKKEWKELVEVYYYKQRFPTTKEYIISKVK